MRTRWILLCTTAALAGCGSRPNAAAPPVSTPLASSPSPTTTPTAAHVRYEQAQSKARRAAAKRKAHAAALAERAAAARHRAYERKQAAARVHARLVAAAARLNRCHQPSESEINAFQVHLSDSSGIVVASEARAVNSGGTVYLAARVRDVSGDDPANGGEEVDLVDFPVGQPMAMKAVSETAETDLDVPHDEDAEFEQAATKAMDCANDLAVASEPENQ